MRVAFYTPFVPVSHPNPSGDRTQARNLIAALERQGHQVRVMSEFRTKLFWLKPRRLRQLPSALWTTYRAAVAFRPEVWLTFVSQRDVPDLFGPLLTSWFQIPYVIYKASFKVDYKQLRMQEGAVRHLWSGLPGYLLNWLALFAADHIIVNKSRDYEQYCRYPRIRPKLSLLWPAISTEVFFPHADDRERMRRMLKVSERACLVLSVSRLSDKADRKASSVHFLIDCIADLLGMGHDIKLIIVGEGETRAELEAHARGLGEAVTFVGSVAHENVRFYYNAADIFAFPGFREYIGVVYLEAQACGLPVVAFNNGGIPKVMRNGETGFLVDPWDRETFARRLEQLMSDEGLRQAMGQAGRKYILSHHELDAWGVRLSGFLKKPQ